MRPSWLRGLAGRTIAAGVSTKNEVVMTFAMDQLSSSVRYLAQSIPNFRIRARRVCGLIFKQRRRPTTAFDSSVRHGQDALDVFLHRLIQ